jgi:hypothetical protein
VNGKKQNGDQYEPQVQRLIALPLNKRDSMPHDHITLAQAPNGEIGPRCDSCGIRLTFGNAMVVDKYYLCWDHYVEATGADTSTTVGEAEERFWMTE